MRFWWKLTSEGPHGTSVWPSSAQLWSLTGIPIAHLHGSSELTRYLDYKYEKNAVFFPLHPLLSYVTPPRTLLDQSSGIIPGDSAVEDKS